MIYETDAFIQALQLNHKITNTVYFSIRNTWSQRQENNYYQHYRQMLTYSLELKVPQR